MEVFFTSWDNDLYVVSRCKAVPRVGEYMRFNLPGKETGWMRVAHVTYEYYSISPDKLKAHVYLEEILIDPPFYCPKEKKA